MTGASKTPSATVVICVFNRPQALASCVDSLMAMEEKCFELLIVDDGSTDTTPAVIDRYVRAFHSGGPNRTARSFRTPSRRGVSAVRNLALNEARADIVCFTDSDCTVPADWVTTLRRALEDPTLAAVTGSVRNDPPRNLSEQVHHAVTNPGPNPPPAFLNGNNMAFRLSALGRLRFDEAITYYGEETDFGRRLVEAGHVIGFSTEAITFHHHAMDFGHLMTTARLQGQGSARYARKHRVVLKDVLPLAGAVVGVLLAVVDPRWGYFVALAVALHLAMLVYLGRTRWGLRWGKLLRLSPVLVAYYFCRTYGFFRELSAPSTAPGS